ncbi:ribosomal RNA small subunit methyltransferase A [bacterium AH-315-J21]|nr:ribosomal RNA small subunit methyltransferase A [bacterium AH-315-J21]
MNDFRAKKRFGQHLLRFPADARRIAGLLRDKTGEDPKTIIEIGPGGGALTMELVAMYPASEIIAIEFDRDLLQSLEKQFAGADNLRFIQQDIVTVDLSEIAKDAYVVGNLPYNISAPIMQWTLSQRSSIGKVVYMLQREVARRLCSSPNSKDWSPLAIQTQLRFNVEPGFDLAPERFTPPPKVHSSVFTLTPRSTVENYPEFAEDSATEFEKLVRNAFGSRRKTLVNNLMGKYKYSRTEVTAMLKALGFDERIRAEQLSINDFVKLLRALDTNCA